MSTGLSQETRPARPGEIDYPVVDRYTWAHFAWGVILGAARMPWWGAAGTAVGWELAERPLKRRVPQLFPAKGTQDSLQNSIGDAVAMMGGWVAWQAITSRRRP